MIVRLGRWEAPTEALPFRLTIRTENGARLRKFATEAERDAEYWRLKGQDESPGDEPGDARHW